MSVEWIGCRIIIRGSECQVSNLGRVLKKNFLKKVMTSFVYTCVLLIDKDVQLGNVFSA